MERIEVQGTSRSNEVCPYCRDGLQEPLWTCPGCEVVYHQACRAELGRCATLGCASPPTEVRAPGAEQATEDAATSDPPVAVNVHLLGPLQLLLTVLPPALVVLYTSYRAYVPSSFGFLGPAALSLLFSVPAAYSLALLTRLNWVPRGHRLRALGQSLRSGLIGAVVTPIVILLFVALPQAFSSSSSLTLEAFLSLLAGTAGLGAILGFAAKLTAIVAPYEAASVLAELSRSRRSRASEDRPRRAGPRRSTPTATPKTTSPAVAQVAPARAAGAALRP